MKIIRKMMLYAAVFASAVALTGCESITAEKTEIFAVHSARNSLDWLGVYQGRLPCVDCAGIETRITLYDNGVFSKTDTQIDNTAVKFTEHGDIVWDDDNQTITLVGSEEQSRYKVIENALVPLDIMVETLTGETTNEYILQRITDVETPAQ